MIHLLKQSIEIARARKRAKQMTHKNLKGGLTISRPRGGGGPEIVEIRVHDETSGAQFVTVRICLESFAEAMFGLGHAPCRFDLQPSLVGKARETKHEMVLAPNDYVKESERHRRSRTNYLHRSRSTAGKAA